MGKVKYTKGELKRQRDQLAQFRHYLPTLILKKQQLQIKIFEVRKRMEAAMAELKKQEALLSRWAGLLADPQMEMLTGDEGADRMRAWITPEALEIETVNIAGANVPRLQAVRFVAAEYDYFMTPFWVDKGLAALRHLVESDIAVAVIKRELDILARELRTTTQRVNLFDKVKIPECLENIRRIRIYLGDQQANAVGICKVAKKKIEAVNQQQEVFA